MFNRRIIPALCTALLASALHLNAFAADAVEVRNVAEQEVEIVENGKKVVKRVPVGKAVPGSEIVYTTTFRNLIDKPVGNIAISNPVPNDTVYKSGSARGTNTAITFSVDGAAATLIDAADQPSLGPFVFGTDGRGGNALMVTEGGARPASSGARGTPAW